MDPVAMLDLLAGLGGRSSASWSWAANRHRSTRASDCPPRWPAPSTTRSVRSTSLLDELCAPHGAYGGKGDLPMIRKLVAAFALAALAGVVIRSLPDISAYLKIRDM